MVRQQSCIDVEGANVVDNDGDLEAMRGRGEYVLEEGGFARAEEAREERDRKTRARSNDETWHVGQFATEAGVSGGTDVSARK
jgi:hypothetical protein